MATIHHDAAISEERRRELIYQGDLFTYAATRASLELVALAQEMLSRAFAPHDPETAQRDIAVEDFARLLGELKPRFIHHPECKRLLPDILTGLGCDPRETYFDVPRLRSSTSDDYLTTGIAYAFHPHRDTWYSAPLCQVNFWIPVFPVTADNCMAFHPRYFSRGIKNSSEIYNYQEWNRKSRFSAAEQIGVDTRPQPKALEAVELDPDIRILLPPGGILVFSAAQLHSSIRNTSGRTRYSIDFRTVNLADVRSLRGAPNIDARCTGSTMGDYLRCTDLQNLPSDAVAPYEAGPPQSALT